MRVIAWLIAAAMLHTSGCSTGPPENEIDRLWRAGYGFNNPNPERIKNGRKPLEFHEDVDD